MTTIIASIVTLTGPRQLALRQDTIDAAALDAGDMLCETLFTAISPGTELAAYTGAPPVREGPAYPRLLGYCNVARVLAVGRDVGAVAPGDRVLTFSSHRSHFVLPVDHVLARLPAEVDAAHLACAYLYHLGYNAVLRGGIRVGSRALVIGLGVLGLTAVAMAAQAGADVHAVSNHPRPRQLALRFGARTSASRDQGDVVSAALGSAGADVVICTTNGWDDWALALEMAGTRGTLAVLGFPGRNAPPGDFNPLDSRHFYAKQLRIEAVGHSPERADARGFARFNERDNLGYLVDLIARGRLDAASLISGRYRAAHIEQAYLDLLNRKDDPVTYVLQWNRD